MHNQIIAEIMKYYPEPGRDIDIKDLNLRIEAVFAEHGRNAVQMPPKMYVTLDKGDFRTMPAYVPSMDIAGVKIVNVHPENRRHNLPSVMALIIIIDTETGLPLGIFNATQLTNLRTAAAGAVAAKHLSPGKNVCMGVVGSGRQACALVAAISEEINVDEIRVWSRNERHAEDLCKLHSDFDCRVFSQEKVCDCDVLVTATPSREPLVKREWICEGTHINAIGADAPGKQELDPKILRDAIVFVDDITQAVHSGEINVPVSQGSYDAGMIAGTIGEVVLKKKGRVHSDEITVFDSTGLAIQDLAAAKAVMDTKNYVELDFP